MAGGSRMPRAALVLATSVAVAIALTGCVPPTAQPAVPTVSPSGSATPSPTPTAVPELVPGGTAAQNLEYFKYIVRPLVHKNANVGGRTVIDALVKAGFAKADLEVTPDKTSVGLDADNTEFSVKLGATCIIGQAGNVGFHAFATTVLASGHCLAGKTRTINW
ncbi:MAG: hypothetical protein JWR53_680 [Glaciihabitans sp.]|nr:hypothetical protein [Glaciihabitans sp.]MDQ1556627.1 hypothetical protein [Actinomycetota bacterium]